MASRNLNHIARGSTSLKRSFIPTVSPKRTPAPSDSLVCVRHDSQIPASLLSFFKMDPRTQAEFSFPEKLFHAQVFMHEVDEGVRCLKLAGRRQEARTIHNFSNKLHPLTRLELLRKALQNPAVAELRSQRIENTLKARNNQWGAVKARLGSHQALAATEQGVGYKDRNEDAFLLMPYHRTLALADGMGGHVGGNLASGIAIDFFEHAIQCGIDLEKAIVFANEAILARTKSDPQLGGMRPMGSTFAAVQINGNLMMATYMGDTKILVSRKGAIVFETKDHTQGQQLLEEGLIDTLTAFELNHILNRCLGMEPIRPDRDLDTHRFLLEPGDRVLIATDGITDNYFDENFGLDELAQATSTGSLSQAANRIFDTCLSRMVAGDLPCGRKAKNDNIALALLEFRG